MALRVKVRGIDKRCVRCKQCRAREVERLVYGPESELSELSE